LPQAAAPRKRGEPGDEIPRPPAYRDRASRRVPRLHARRRDRMGRGRARRGRGDPAARRLRRGDLHGRADGRVRRGRIPLAGRREGGDPRGGARAKHAVPRRVPRPPDARRCARRPGRAHGRGRGRRAHGRPHRGRPRRSAARRAGRPGDLPAMARLRGDGAARGRRHPGLVAGLRDPVLPGRAHRLGHPVSCRADADDGRRMGRSAGLCRFAGKHPRPRQPRPLRRGDRPQHARLQPRCADPVREFRGDCAGQAKEKYEVKKFEKSMLKIVN